MKTIDAGQVSPLEFYSYLTHAIAPRPICFASTIDKEGNVNLSPFSFFNLMGMSPPICVFSPVRRGRDNTAKHTLENIIEVPECVINIVNYNMVHQTSLASIEYPKGCDEFVKSGFTPLASELVKPPRVAESPVQLECVVTEIIPLGYHAGAGNLVIAEVKLMHINENILDANGKIDQQKIDLVARLGANWYSRVTPESLFEVAKPTSHRGIGVDAIPFAIRNSTVLTGNNLGQLGNVEALPGDEEIEAYSQTEAVKELLDATIGDSQTRLVQLHIKAKALLDAGNVMDAWKVLLM